MPNVSKPVANGNTVESNNAELAFGGVDFSYFDTHENSCSRTSSKWVNPLRDAEDKRLPRIAGPCGMVIFGVTGDLARKKLLPAIYDLAHRGLLPAGFSLVGYGRRGWSKADFENYVKQAVVAGARTDFRENVWARLAEGMHFVQGNFDDDAAFDSLASLLADLDQTRGTAGNWAFYLSVPPDYFSDVCHQLQRSGMATAEGNSWRRVIVEKPFGHDQESARQLNNLINSVFPEKSVFRIDHYLGKETVQNIMALRFANQLFDPLWNSHYVDHVQITMAEDIGLGGRAGYYDGIGAARDVIQNHLIQLLALVAMEEPVAFTPQELQAEKIKVLRATRPVEPFAKTTARGQYSRGWQGSELVQGLREEDGFDPNSGTETYAACTLEINSRRWAGVPFYLRTGKRLGRRVTEIALVFKDAPHQPFSEGNRHSQGRNVVVIRVQPDEGMLMRFGSKVPGNTMEVRDVNMDFSYSEAFTEESPEAYERLILDALLDEASLFPTNEEVELSWQILDPILNFWSDRGQPEEYAAGTWGPAGADKMLEREGRAWRRP
ncbi:glucose-6-phosphate dehydrogenase [Corynebacterium diphtheriae]|uniref:glucose-6-phosphate dehydrogenase n=1 Tax=Corynebacterium diphtheriae TaxID=1717 RepID=UPI000B4AAE24|nr:glucose-6-phosphate dehydrogenase [Corynebacterium diphtheriae]OWM43653.1 glucose-6-phosphate dehydrogenase [Corynebacterium diphtheriae]OWM48884.1 glucose-6-phosphate dehydrogenase [Corynebacterium diphtheriae]OWN42393.1 glucose-6-phosphate dehydrogenase [Corynebacterium diphtheriae bv. mitis]OWN61311.1 glucose-6-phosphate dehydrogenase [Corynebacterium diphtheriae bv. mitis]OWN81211.1 glucose-6-phosphate dehydrogenase [Corynebacterium diphtheriae bv. mitis]